jgi:hypothetical protein
MIAALTAIMLLASACDEAGSDPMVNDEPRIELGSGIDTWTSFDSTNPAIKVTFGLQGGFHLELAARFWGVDPEGVSLGFEVFDVTTGEVLNFPTRYILSALRTDCFEEGYCQRLGVRAIFDMTEDPEVALLGKELRLVLTLSRTFGKTLVDERIVRVDEVGW